MEPAIPPGMIDYCPNALQGASATLFLTLTNALFAARCDLGPNGRYPPDHGPHLKDGDEFDFIVVGAGTAGSVVASRLSEISHWKVLVLEAGSYPSSTSEIPLLTTALKDSHEDWKYTIEPSSSYCNRVSDDRFPCPKGKGLGGSSTINGMAYSRSIKYDHDAWVNAGNDEWNHDSIINIYKNIENVQGEKDTGQYGTSGKLFLTRPITKNPLRQTLINAYTELGYDKYTEENPLGFQDSLMIIHRGTRQNTAKAYLSPAKNRQNLYVAINAEVDRLLVDKDQKEVSGVEVVINNKRLKLYAKKEVVLSAGAVNSPYILLKTGIGLKEHLSDVGIEVVNDLKVGDNNFYDHLGFRILAVALDSQTAPRMAQEDSLDTLYQLFMHRKVDMGLAPLLFFTNTLNNTEYANIEYLHIFVQQNDAYALSEIVRFLGIPKAAAISLHNHNKNDSLLLFLPMLLVSTSRGSVRLQKDHPTSKPPLIIPHCLSNEDIEALLDSVKFIQKLIKTPAFAKYNPRILDLDVPNCKSLEPQSNDFWRCAIGESAFPIYHHVGTCKMGPVSDPNAVVDQRLKLHGVKNIRVVDASIIPTLRTNPFGVMVMVGEKGSEMIKKDWLQNKFEL